MLCRNLRNVLTSGPLRRRAFTHIVVAFLLLVGASWAGLASSASAQMSGGAVPGYAIKRWTTVEGLPHNWITAILQTGDRYLWFGTNNAGLVRFDGVQFETFNLLNTPALKSNDITALHEDADGTLWIGTMRGLARYTAGTFVDVPMEEILSNAAIRNLRSDSQGRLIVAGVREVVRREADSWSPVLHDEQIESIWLSSDDTIWIGTDTGLVEWRDRVVRRFTVDDGLPRGDVLALLEDRDGRLWVGTTNGLVYLERRTVAASFQRGPPSAQQVTALFEDSTGVLWIGGVDRLFRRDRDGELSAGALSPVARRLRTAAIHEDHEGNIWIGVEGWNGGLYRLRRQAVSSWLGERLPCENTGAITQGGDGTVWLSTFCEDGRGLFAIRGQEVVPHHGPAFVTSLLAEPDGTVWAGTYGGTIYRFDGRRFVEVDSPARNAADVVSVFHRDRGGALWVATTDNGLFRLQDGQWTSIQTKDGLPSNDVRSLAAGSDGSIWIGMDGRVSRYQDGQLTSYRGEDGVPPGQIRAIHVDSEAVVWIGSYGGGLARLKNGAATRFGVRAGLLDSTVHRILEDGDGFLWLSGDRGIRRVSKSDLNAVADGRATALSVALFGEADGMRSAEGNGMAQPAGWRMQDGMFYFPTQAGPVRVNPAALDTNVSLSTPLIHSLIADRAWAPAATDIVVPPGRREVEIRFTAPSFVRPELVQFRYRLEGFSDEWIEVGTRRAASFAGLPPGRYRFVVQAGDGSAWSESSAPLAFRLQPYLHQRRSLQLALIALLVAAGIGVTRGYVRGVRRRALELETAVVARTAELSAAHAGLSIANEHLVKAKGEVEQAHEQVLAVLNQVDIGVFVLDPAGIVRYASASAQRLLRKDERALVGQVWSDCLPLVDSDRAKVRERVETTPGSGGRTPAQVTIDGTRYWMEIDVRDEPPPGIGRILYMYGATELSAPSPGDRSQSGEGLIGRSTAMQVIYKQIRDVARVDCTVLIEGETGVGKELVARAIHRGSRRAVRPFIAVNAAGLTESLLSSQLFGHRRGAFTGAVDDQLGLFEAANGGTLFLDEIGDMPLNVQASLLRVLQEGEITRVGESHARKVDVRVLAATHRNLTREVEERRFREDLLYRIRVATIVVPPLRERLEDIPLLVDAFLMQAARKQGRAVPHVTRETIEALTRHSWPGNVRELRAVLESALVGSADDVIRIADLRAEIAHEPPAPVRSRPVGGSEKDRIVAALRQTSGNRKEAARLLGIGRTTLYRRLVEYGLESDPDPRSES
jgi:DNA-binding NtrC family response regulator/ligand-binding sensor domain-containing protein